MAKIRIPTEFLIGIAFMTSVAMCGYLMTIARRDVLEILGWSTTLTAESRNMLKYGVLSWVVWLPFYGIFSMTVGGLIARLFRRELHIPLWYAISVGILYALCFFLFLLYLPTGEGAGIPEGSGRFLDAFMFLFPAIAVVICPFMFRRSNIPMRPTAGNGG